MLSVVVDVLDDPVHAAAMGERGREAVESLFSGDAVVAQIEDVYREVTE